MIKIADLPVVRAQLVRTATPEQDPLPTAEANEYARAPAAPGPQATGSRPPATQGNSR